MIVSDGIERAKALMRSMPAVPAWMSVSAEIEL